MAQRAIAGSATWNLDPTSNDWNTAANWTPATVPNGADSVAIFNVSNTTNLSVSDFIEVDRILFNPGASAYTYSVAEGYAGFIAFEGVGVVNNSGTTQNFDCFGNVGFNGQATAGDNVVYTNEDDPGGFFIPFNNESNAGSATFINNGASPTTYGASLYFRNESSAANSTIINNGPRGGENGGSTSFADTSTAGQSTIIVNAGGFAEFTENATAGDAILMIDGGEMDFEGLSLGGLAQVRLSHGGLLVMEGHAKASLILGSLEGEGTVQVASQEFGIGSNGLDTTFAGVIAEATGKPKIAMVRKVGAAR